MFSARPNKRGRRNSGSLRGIILLLHDSSCNMLWRVCSSGEADDIEKAASCHSRICCCRRRDRIHQRRWQARRSGGGISIPQYATNVPVRTRAVPSGPSTVLVKSASRGAGSCKRFSGLPGERAPEASYVRIIGSSTQRFKRVQRKDALALMSNDFRQVDRCAFHQRFGVILDQPPAVKVMLRNAEGSLTSGEIDALAVVPAGITATSG